MKLEWLLKHEFETYTRNKNAGLEAETPDPFEDSEHDQLIELTPKEHRRLYDLLRY